MKLKKVLVSFLIPATIIVAAQLSMAIRGITQSCFIYDQAPTEDHFHANAVNSYNPPSHVQAIKRFFKRTGPACCFPGVDMLLTLSYLACYGPYHIDTLVNIINSDIDSIHAGKYKFVLV